MALDRREYNREYQRMYRKRYPERCRAATRKWKEKMGPEIVALASNHGLSYDEARAAIDARPDVCEICARAVKLYYDHDHSTKKHRGWLCNRCNVALGLIEQTQLLGSALLYLERMEA